MAIIKVSKTLEDMDDNTLLKEAIRELQAEQKKQGKTLKFDIEEREQKIKAKKTTVTS